MRLGAHVQARYTVVCLCIDSKGKGLETAQVTNVLPLGILTPCVLHCASADCDLFRASCKDR